MMNTRRHADGFTLIEVLLVLLILGGLVSLAVFTLGGREEGARTQMSEIRVKKIMGRLGEYKLAIGHYPTEEEGGLQALITKPTFEDENKGKKWVGPYVEGSDLKDDWDNDLKYELAEDDSGRKSPRVSSNGPDGQEGTEDDIKSWSEEDAT